MRSFAARRGGWGVLGWCLLYALLCALDFIIDKCKDAVEERIWPSNGDDDDDDKPE